MMKHTSMRPFSPIVKPSDRAAFFFRFHGLSRSPWLPESLRAAAPETLLPLGGCDDGAEATRAEPAALLRACAAPAPEVAAPDEKAGACFIAPASLLPASSAAALTGGAGCSGACGRTCGAHSDCSFCRSMNRPAARSWSSRLRNMMSLSALCGANPWALACWSISSRPRSPSLVMANTSSISNCSAAATCEVKSDTTSVGFTPGGLAAGDAMAPSTGGTGIGGTPSCGRAPSSCRPSLRRSVTEARGVLVGHGPGPGPPSKFQSFKFPAPTKDSDSESESSVTCQHRGHNAYTSQK